MAEDTKIPSGEQKREGELPPNLKVYLEVLEGPESGKKFELKKVQTSIGRKECDILLNDPTISSKHCTIEVSREEIMIYDHNSTNGTLVNGERISICPLQNLDEILIGESKLLLSVVRDRYAIYQEPGTVEVDVSKVRFDEETLQLEGGVYNPELPEEYNAVLEIEEGANKGQRFRLKRRSTVVGRGKDADLVLDDEGISLRHMQIEVHSKDKITIKDLASTNGTRVNGKLVSAVKIRNQDQIELGKTKMTFYFRVNR